MCFFKHQHRGEIQWNNQNLIFKLDFIMAKGKLSSKMRGEPAMISGYDKDYIPGMFAPEEEGVLK